MSRNSVIVALVLAAVGLSACGERGHMVNAKICANFKTTNTGQAGVPAIAPTDAATPVDECTRRWAYSLAGARDSADVVADATVAACSAALSRWNQAALTQVAQPPADGSEQALSLSTGQPTNALAEHSAFAHDRALFYVVQARAGRCAPPPATNGLPAGT